MHILILGVHIMKIASYIGKIKNDLSVGKDSCNAGMVYAKWTREEEKIDQLQHGLFDEMIAVKDY